MADIHASALAVLEESDFRAVCNRTPEKAIRLAGNYNVKAYTDIEEMIVSEKLEVVINGVPHPYHAETTVASMKAGAHVLVEKPLASSLEDCDTIIKKSEETGLLVGTICQRRFYEPCQRIRKAIDDGKIGKPVLGAVNMFGWRDKAYYESDPWRGTWKDEGGGVLVNQAPHQLDLLLWYMGEVESLYGFWDNLNHPYIEVEDTAVAVIRFKNGGLGNIVVSNSQNPALYGKVCVYGSIGAAIGVQTDGGAMFIAGMSGIAEPPFNDYWTIPGEEEMSVLWKKQDLEFFKSINPVYYYHKLQVQDFLQAVLQNRQPLVTAGDGRACVELFTAVYRSQRDNTPVIFPLKPENNPFSFDGRLK